MACFSGRPDVGEVDKWRPRLADPTQPPIFNDAPGALFAGTSRSVHQPPQPQRMFPISIAGGAGPLPTGGREWVSNPPGTGLQPHPDLKSGRSTGNDSPPH